MQHQALQKSKQCWLPRSDTNIIRDTAGHYQAIGDQVNMAPKLEPPVKRRPVWSQTVGIS